MANKKKNDDETREENPLFEECLLDANRQSDYKKAHAQNDNSFISFSDGLPCVQKFQILEDSSKSPVDKGQQVSGARNIRAKTQRAGEDSFTSFSEGLPAADRFTILDAHKRITSGELMLLHDFMRTDPRPYLFDHANQTGANSGKSPALKRLVYLLNTVPWRNELLVDFCLKPSAREFRFQQDTMVLDNSSSDDEFILDFAHQSYHACNRFLTKLYDGHRLDHYAFIDLFLWAEVGALITELNVRRDLGIKKAPPDVVLCQERSGSLSSINLEHFLKEKGMKGLHDALVYSMVRGDPGTSLLSVLDELYESYSETYDDCAKEAQMTIRTCLSLGLDTDCI